MLTTSNISMIQSGEYYGKDDYYSRTLTKEDFWYGHGLLSPLGEDIPNPYQDISAPSYSCRLRTKKKLHEKGVSTRFKEASY